MILDVFFIAFSHVFIVFTNQISFFRAVVLRWFAIILQLIPFKDNTLANVLNGQGGHKAERFSCMHHFGCIIFFFISCLEKVMSLEKASFHLTQRNRFGKLYVYI